MVLRGDLLRAQVLFDRHRIVGAALDRGVVADDHALGAGHAADAGDDARAGRVAAIHAVRRHRRQFQERGARIDQVFHAVARQELAARGVLGAGGLAAAQGRLRQLLVQVVQLSLHGARVVDIVLRPRIDAGFDDGHGVPPVLLDWNLKALEKRAGCLAARWAGHSCRFGFKDFVAPFLHGPRPTRRGDCNARKAQRNPARDTGRSPCLKQTAA